MNRAEVLRRFRTVHADPPLPVLVADTVTPLLGPFYDETAKWMAGVDLRCPTPARPTGWTAAQTIRHLLHGEHLARGTVLGDAEQSLAPQLARHGHDPTAVVAAGLDGEAGPGDAGAAIETIETIEAWRQAARATLHAVDDAGLDTRVPWVLGVDARSLAVARLSETWAHILDVAAATGADARSLLTPWAPLVAWWALRTLPYAVARARVELPDGIGLVLRVGELGQSLWVGDPAGDAISGSALALAALGCCRLGLAGESVSTTGPLAAAVAPLLRTFP